MSHAPSFSSTPTEYRPVSWRHGLGASLGVASATFLVVASVAWSGMTPAHAAEATVGLGTASSYAVLAGSAVTNTGPSTISGDLGVSPGTSVTGFPPGVVTGATHAADAEALQAQQDLTTAYNDAAGRSTTTDVTGTDLGGQTLVSGVYEHTSGMQLTGTVTLDAEGDPDAVFIFKAGSTLVTASGSSVQLINGASPCRVFWQVGSSATIGTGTQFAGTVMALTSATLQTGANVDGRILARNGAVTLDTNNITASSCGVVPTTPTGTPSQSETSGPSDSPSTNGPRDTGSDTTQTFGTPTIPSGHPHTGLTPSDASADPPWLLLGLAALTAMGGALAFTRGARTTRRH